MARNRNFKGFSFNKATMFFLEFLINISNENFPKNTFKTSSACYTSLFVHYLHSTRRQEDEIILKYWPQCGQR